ncbi:MAG TPA: hypothetical protein VGL77_02810, partial [Armatimonadota bacterium]
VQEISRKTLQNRTLVAGLPLTYSAQPGAANGGIRVSGSPVWIAYIAGLTDKEKEEIAKAEVVSCGSAIIENGGRGYVELKNTLIPGVDISELLAHPDNSVTASFHPISLSNGVIDPQGVVTGVQAPTIDERLRVKAGDSILASVPIGTGKAKKISFLLITPTVDRTEDKAGDGAKLIRERKSTKLLTPTN